MAFWSCSNLFPRLLPKAKYMFWSGSIISYFYFSSMLYKPYPLLLKPKRETGVFERTKIINLRQKATKKPKNCTIENCSDPFGPTYLFDIGGTIYLLTGGVQPHLPKILLLGFLRALPFWDFCRDSPLSHHLFNHRYYKWSIRKKKSQPSGDHRYLCFVFFLTYRLHFRYRSGYFL